MKKKRELFIKILAGLLVAGMLIGLLPMFASAAGTEPGVNTPSGGSLTNPDDETNEDLHLHKTAVLQEDGTWTITLEAFATGTVTRTYTEKVKPTDIIMILDQSGSMDSSDQYIENSGYQLATTMPTNEQMATGNTVYYHFDANDQKYYPVTATQVIVTHDTYWKVTKSCTINGVTYNAGDKFCLESEAEGKVATSWTYNNFTSNFEHDHGYLLDDYRLYQMSGSWSKYTYVQRLGTDYQQNGQTLDGVSGNNRDAALKALRNKFPDYQVDQVTTGSSLNRTYYALVYIPVELVENETSYYTYTYMDDQGQRWTLGHSSTSGDIDQETYNLGSLYVTSTSKGPRLTALKTAATAFINHVHSASNKQMADHRIAVVGFASTSTTGTNYGNEYMYSNTELFVGATQYNYMQGGKESTVNSGEYYADGKLKTGDVAGNIYLQALQNVRTEAGHNNLLASIGALGAKGGTFPSHGFEMAVEIAKANENVYASGERDLIIIFMTDGEPSWSDSDKWDNSNSQRGPKGKEADKTIALANTLKSEYNATIRTVALLGSTPTEDSDNKVNDEDDFLDAVTSSVVASGTNHYVLAKNGVDLKNFFNTIHVNVESNYSSITLSENAFLVDRVSEYFNMPVLVERGADETEEAYRQRASQWLQEHVTVYTADHIGKMEFMTAVEQEVTYDINVSDPEKDGKIHVWPTFGGNDGVAHGITVHNFDYLSDENMVTTEHIGYIDANQSNGSKDIYTAPVTGEFTDTNGNGKYDIGEPVENGVDYLITMEQAEGNPNAHYTMLVSGKKLKVVITGITAKDSAAQEVYLPTNDVYSGLWDKDSSNNYGMLKAFPMPRAKINDRIYVIDYAKEACLASLDVTRKALALDQAKDAILSPVDINDAKYDELSTSDIVGYGANGKAITALKFGDAYIKDNSVYYSPKTTNWYGYDSFYIFWQASNKFDADNNLVWSEGDPVTGYCWSKVNVMPANNVYYEDTFVTTSTDGSTQSGRVGIEFGKGWSFTTVGDDAGKNTEKPESAGQNATLGTHGWVDSLADDTGFTDGTAAKGDGNAMAKATFTFTGTGVDIYSYTDDTTGTILVEVKPIDVADEYDIPTYYYLVDNYAASGDYYAIPTISYMARGTMLGYTDENGVVHPAEEALVYGKYQVTITVTAAAAHDGGRVSYYLDGIRVYNPLGSERENDPLVAEGYGKEVHAFFYNIRDYLLDAAHFDAQYTVSFDANGGSKPVDDEGKEMEVAQITVTNNGTQMPECAFGAPEGMQFKGWALTSDGDILSGTEYITSDTVLYAIWENKTEEAPAEYALNLVAQLTQFASGAVLIDQVKEGQSDVDGTPLKTDVIGIYEEYGPKNEVYLAQDQKIVMKVNLVEGRTFFVGLKSPTGKETSVAFSNGDKTAEIAKLSHTFGLYYKVVPTVDKNDPTVGYIAIENKGAALLAVCKFQITGLDPNPHDDEDFDSDEDNTATASVEPEPLLPISGDEATRYAATFARMARAPYEGEGSNAVDDGNADQIPDEPEVDIEGAETPDEPSFEDEIRDKMEALVARLFKSVRDWFKY